MVVRERADPKARRIVVGVDGSASCDKAIGFAFDAASRSEAPLTAIHAWHDMTTFAVAGPSYAALANVAERISAGERLLGQALAGWAEKYPGVTVTREAIPVHPGRVDRTPPSTPPWSWSAHAVAASSPGCCWDR